MLGNGKATRQFPGLRCASILRHGFVEIGLLWRVFDFLHYGFETEYLPNNTLTLFMSELPVTRSTLPSPLRSAAATRHAPGPTGIGAAGLKAPRPSPNNTRMLVPFVATTSMWPSPFTSAMLNSKREPPKSNGGPFAWGIPPR